MPVLRFVPAGLLALAAIAAIAAPRASAAATLIGDELTFSRNFPTPDTPYGPEPLSATVTVSAGDADLASWSGGGWGPPAGTVYAQFNPEALSIEVALPNAGGYGEVGNAGEFDGYVIKGFSHEILSASASYSGLSLVVLPHELRLDFEGLVPAGAFTIALTMVPEPGSAALWCAGLLGIAAFRRRVRSAAVA